jgi:hypothetical protein
VKRGLAALAGGLCVGLPTPALSAACDLPPDAGAVLAAGSVRLAWQALPAAPRVGEPFELHVATCPAHAVLQSVDATMPEHRHGMNYRPSVHRLGEGRWRVEGLLWHMSGRWELALVVQAGDERQRLTQSVQLP